MKYLYKHGNQYWYQRAVPYKILSFVKKKSIKICLKTNKLQCAMERSKIQANSHDKMFNYLLNQNKSIIKLFQNKVFDIKKYEISFSDDFDDLVGNFLFSKKYIINNIINISKKNISYSSLEQLIFEKGELYFPLLSLTKAGWCPAFTHLTSSDIKLYSPIIEVTNIPPVFVLFKSLFI